MIRKIFLTLFLLTVTTTVVLGLTPPSAKIGMAHNGAVVHVLVFSQNGKMLASGASNAHTVKLWDVETKKETSLFIHPTVRNLTFSPNGSILASCGDDQNVVMLWDIAGGNSITTLKGHTDAVTSIDFSDDGKTIASGSRDSTVKIWSVPDGNLIATLEGYIEERDSGVIDVDFSSDGKFLLSAFMDGTNSLTVTLWDVGQRKAIKTFHNEIFEDKVDIRKGIGFTPDNNIIVPRGDDILLLDVPSLETIDIVVKGVRRISTMALSENGNVIAVEAKDTIVFDAKTKKPLINIGNDQIRAAISPDGKILATSDWDGSINFWSVPASSGGNKPPDIANPPPDEEGFAVFPSGKLPTTWGAIKAQE